MIATEPLAAFFGGDGLGVYLRQGLGNQDFNEVQAGALLVTAHRHRHGLPAVPGSAEPCCRRACNAAPPVAPLDVPSTQPPSPDKGTNQMRTSRWRLLLALLVPFALLVACCGDDKSDDSSGSGSGSGSGTTPASDTTIRIVPQDFAESMTLSQVYAQFLESQGLQGRGAGRQRLPRDRLPGARGRQGRPDHRLHRQRRHATSTRPARRPPTRRRPTRASRSRSATSRSRRSSTRRPRTRTPSWPSSPSPRRTT